MDDKDLEDAQENLIEKRAEVISLQLQLSIAQTDVEKLRIIDEIRKKQKELSDAGHFWTQIVVDGM